MPAVNIFETIRTRIEKSPAFRPHERRAMYWFKSFFVQLEIWQRQLGAVTFAKLAEQPIAKRVVSQSAMLPGFLYFFKYEPKGEKTLPYYDAFPLVLVIDKHEDSFTGLNFHYLDYFWRAWLFDNLYEARKKHTDPLKVSMQFSYDYLSRTTKYKQFRPCFKRYLYSHLRSPLLQVGDTEWDVALWLPVEMYQKQTAPVIWKESERKF